MNSPRERISLATETNVKGHHDDEPAYVLHSYPYRETSLVAELFTRNHGRVGLVARGAKRAKSAMRGVLQPFQPLSVSWFGKSELRTLAKAEWQRALPQLAGTALMSAFYLNELLLKLTRRDDTHERLFDSYGHAIAALGEMESNHGNISVLLRRFELGLLRELGYAVPLGTDVGTGESVVDGATFEYVIESGPIVAKPSPDRVQFRGKTLLDIVRDDYSDPVTIQETKQLMRMLINHYLAGQLLHTRQFIKDLRDL